LEKVRKGKPLCFDVNSIGCFAGRRYLGFSEAVMPNFEYFLPRGIPSPSMILEMKLLELGQQGLQLCNIRRRIAFFRFCSVEKHFMQQSHLYGNDPNNWDAGNPSPGTANP
jgi:hypothetical protein